MTTKDISNDIYSCVKPFITLMKVFGLFPLINDKGNFRIDIFSVVFSIGSFVILLYAILVNIHGLEHIGDTSIVLSNIWNISWMVGLFSLLVMKVYQWIKHKSVANLIQAINDIDLKVRLNNFNECQKLISV